MRGQKGPPNSFGSSCIRLNGTNYKSRAISPHYSERTGGGGSQWESEGREKSRVRHYMKNRYEDKFGKPDKEEEGRRAACEKSQREEGMGGQELEKGARAGN